MPTTNLKPSTTRMQYYIDILSLRHNTLSDILDDEYKFRSKDQELIRQIKIEKLRLKDEIELMKRGALN